LSRYSPARKEAILKKLLPPYPRSIFEIAKEEGIPEATLYNWRKAVREKGAAVPSKKTLPAVVRGQHYYLYLIEGIYSRKIVGYEVFYDESQDGIAWVNRFVEWYNNEHKHRGLNYLTPSERHAGKDSEILQKRAAVLEVRRKQNPERWSGEIRNCKPVGDVHLNPEKEVA
jgi:transposase InsO family protein